MTTTTTTTVSTSRFERLPLASLLRDKNIRESRPSKQLADSVKALGVVTPITAYDTADGVRVRDGHQRLAAAELAGITEIDCVIAASLDEAETIIAQLAANVHVPMTDADTARAMEQASLFGMSAEMIAAKTGHERAHVEAAITARQNAAAAASLDQGHTVEEALIFAEFDGDEKATAALEDQLNRDRRQLPHMAQKLRNDLADQAIKEQIIAELAERGITAVDYMASYVDPYRETAPVECLRHRKGGADATEADSNVAEVTVRNGETTIRYGIRDFKADFKQKIDRVVEPKSEEQKVKERLNRQRTADLRAAETVRREWLTTLLARKSAPKAWIDFHAAAIIEGRYELNRDNEGLTCELLGVKGVSYFGDKKFADYAKRNASMPWRIVLAQLLSRFEKTVDPKTAHLTRSYGRETIVASYFYQLREWGYALSEEEERIAGPVKKAPAKTAPKTTVKETPQAAE